MRRACHVIMQAHRALPGGILSWPSSIQVVTPFNAPQPPPPEHR
jgi:LacI family transcriptional regulator